MATLLYQHEETGLITWADGNINHRWYPIPSIAEDELPQDITAEKMDWWNENSCMVYGERRGPKI